MAKQLIHSSGDVMKVVQHMDELIMHSDTPRAIIIEPLRFIEDEANRLRKLILDGRMKEEGWQRTFVHIGAAAKGLIEQWNVYHFTDLLLKKHVLYGAKPLLLWKELGICVRLTNKVERLKNLIANPTADTQGESYDDTLHDIVGYCVLGWWLKERKY